MATERGGDSETKVLGVKDSETEVPEAESVLPEMVRLKSTVVPDRVSEIVVHRRNSTGNRVRIGVVPLFRGKTSKQDAHSVQLP